MPSVESIPEPGTSPFKAKGLVYQGARDFYAEVVPGGFEAVAARAAREHPTGAMARFLRESFTPGLLYDALPIRALSEAAARLRGTTHDRLVRDNAAWLARRDVPGVFKFLLQFASVESLATRLPALSTRYFDFGRSETEMTGATSLTTRRFGVPLHLARWFTWTVEGFTPAALAFAKAREVRVASSEPTPEPGSSEHPTVRIDFRVSWG